MIPKRLFAILSAAAAVLPFLPTRPVHTTSATTRRKKVAAEEWPATKELFLNGRSVWNYVHYFRRKVAAFKKKKSHHFVLFTAIFLYLSVSLDYRILYCSLVYFSSVFFFLLPVHQHFKCLPCICVARIAPNKNVWIKWYLWTMFFFDKFVKTILFILFKLEKV